ncbi:hypothetical protein D3C86_1464030 [compost metagenome]
MRGDRRTTVRGVSNGDRKLHIDPRDDLEVLRFEGETQGIGIAGGIGVQLIGVLLDAQPSVERQLPGERCGIPQAIAPVDVDHRHLRMQRVADRVSGVLVIVGTEAGDHHTAGRRQWRIDPHRQFACDVSLPH